VALWSFLTIHVRRIKLFSGVILKLKHRLIKKYLRSNYSRIIGQYAKKPSGELPAIDYMFPIWVCWWDGKENMPALVRACFQSVCNNSAGHPVILLTKHNYQEHVKIPVHVVEKADRGLISLTHLSEVLRMGLLCQKGGLWVDATILMTKHSTVLSSNAFFTIKHKNDGTYVSECRWTGFCIGGNKGNILFNCMSDLLCEYWKREDVLIDYFIFDYFLALAYESVGAIKAMIDTNPFNNLQLYDIRYKLKSEFDNTSLEEICADTEFHKLTWKESFPTTTSDGKPTFYGHILSNYAAD
jgi:hypothetical protein